MTQFKRTCCSALAFFSTLSVANADVCNRTFQVVSALEQQLGLRCTDIADADLFRVRELNLSNTGIHVLGEDSFDGMINLEKLDLSQNGLLVISPAHFSGRLFRLRILNLADNQLSVLADTLLQNLPGLESIDLRNNRISVIPEVLFQPSLAIQGIFLSGNQFKTLPVGIFRNLTYLAELSLSGNPFESLPEKVFSGLPYLRTMDASFYHFKSSVSRKIYAGLVSLQSLTVTLPADPRIGMVPKGLLDGLVSLQKVRLSSNPNLFTLPEDLFWGLGNLGTIYLNDCAFVAFPPRLFQGLEASPRFERVFATGNPLTDAEKARLKLELGDRISF